jgi:hypothetical protein
MPRKKRNREQQHKSAYRPNHPLKSGSQLFTKKVVLADCKELSASTIQGPNGYGRIYCTSNGVRTAD